MQAITTRYIGATNFKPSRIKATCAGGTVTVPWNHELNEDGNHRDACRALLIKMEWVGSNYAGMVGGVLPNGTWAWVFLDSHSTGR